MEQIVIILTPEGIVKSLLINEHSGWTRRNVKGARADQSLIFVASVETAAGLHIGDNLKHLLCPACEGKGKFTHHNQTLRCPRCRGAGRN